jgi:Sphingolipid Delta4-desaturase (DES)
MIKRTDFVYSEESEPHRIRTKKMLKEFPHIRELIGKNPLTIFAILGIVAFMVVLAWLVRDQSWWVVFLAAYCLGAFGDHALFVLIHECAHHLLFKLLPTSRKFSQAQSRSNITILSTTRFRVCMSWTPTCPIIGKLS